MRPTALIGAAVIAAGLVGPVVAAGATPAANPAAAVTIMALGDSITYGMTAPETATPGGYRGYLAQDLTAEGVAWVYEGSSGENPPLGADPGRYRHEGHPGYRVDQIATGLDGPDAGPGAGGGYWLTGNRWHPPVRPGVVILHIGTNDLAQGFDPQGRYPNGFDRSDPDQRARFVSDLVARLEALLTKIQQLDPGARVVLCTIAPMGTVSPDATAHAYDDAIRSQVVPWERGQGVQVALADVEAAFMATPGGYHDEVGPDGVHPTPMGYQTMANTLAPAVRAVLAQG